MSLLSSIAFWKLRKDKWSKQVVLWVIKFAADVILLPALLRCYTLWLKWQVLSQFLVQSVARSCTVWMFGVTSVSFFFTSCGRMLYLNWLRCRWLETRCKLLITFIFCPNGTAVCLHLEHIVFPFDLSLCPKWGEQMPVLAPPGVRAVSVAIRMADPVQSALPMGHSLTIWPLVVNLFLRLSSLEPRQLFHWCVCVK